MALDFGMALSKGLIAPQKSLQDEVRKLAGDQFKSEDWWNKQLDRQIKKGITENKGSGLFFGFNRQRDLSAGELKAIENQSKEQTRLLKRETAQDKKGKRTARGSSGLMGRSTKKDEGLAVGLPALGSLGLGIGKTKLG